jgi:hypothetical protein
LQDERSFSQVLVEMSVIVGIGVAVLGVAIYFGLNG